MTVAGTVNGPGPLPNFLKQALVPQVDPVEVTDGQDRVGKGLVDLFQVGDQNLHGLVNTTLTEDN